MTKMSIETPNKANGAKRRDFLKLASVGSLLGGAAVAIGSTPAQAAIDVRAEENGDYRETAHVKAYYETSRF